MPSVVLAAEGFNLVGGELRRVLFVEGIQGDFAKQGAAQTKNGADILLGRRACSNTALAEKRAEMRRRFFAFG